MQFLSEKNANVVTFPNVVKKTESTTSKKKQVGIVGDPKLSKQMRSFGTLYGPQRTQKKSSEQLRSSSIDGSRPMVCTGTIKLKKGSVCFWISGPVCQRTIVEC